MSGLEKREAAWKLVKEKNLSKSQIIRLGIASDGTVSTMRKVLRKLEEQGKNLTTVSWVEARMIGIEHEDWDAQDWRAKKARKIVDALLKAKIGQGLAKDPEVTALALQMLNPTLPGALVRLWWFDDPELKSEMADELKKDDDPYGLLEEPEEAEATTMEF
jgi:hypothetical protein